MSLTSYRAAPPRVTSVNPKGLSRLREPLCGSCFIRANLKDLSLVPSVSRVVAYRVTDANRGAICRLIQRKSRSDLSSYPAQIAERFVAYFQRKPRLGLSRLRKPEGFAAPLAPYFGCVGVISWLQKRQRPHERPIVARLEPSV